MDAWAGMERFLNLSLGSQVGANGVALIAVLELKRILQHQAGYQNEPKTNKISITAEEWRSVAGIYERKAFDRAKIKLEELGVLGIERKGKILEIALWPDPINVEEGDTPRDPAIPLVARRDTVVPAKPSVRTETSLEEDVLRLGLMKSPSERIGASIGASIETSYGTSNGISSETIHETDHGTGSEINHGTDSGTNHGAGSETSPGTDPGTNHGAGSVTSPGTSSWTSRETGTVSLSKFGSTFREDEVLTKRDVRMNVGPLRDQRSPLNRYSSNRYSSNRKSIYNNNGINDTTDNVQPANGRWDHNPFASSSEELGTEFAIHWVQEVGHPLTAYEKEGLVRFFRLGYTEDLCVEALRNAVAADNCRMGYVLGILRNWYQEGVRCLEDVALVKKRWEDQRFLKRGQNCRV